MRLPHHDPQGGGVDSGILFYSAISRQAENYKNVVIWLQLHVTSTSLANNQQFQDHPQSASEVNFSVMAMANFLSFPKSDCYFSHAKFLSSENSYSLSFLT